MAYTDLISAQQLQNLLDSGEPLLIVDCSADLTDAAAGRKQYLEAHLPGAIYADLNTDLSATTGTAAASGGRHPLPNRAAFARWVCSQGIRPGMQVVAYDRQNMAFSARLWWMLKWLGHEAVAILDGGLAAWHDAAGVLSSEVVARPGVDLERDSLAPALVEMMDAGAMWAGQQAGTHQIIDARAAPRYRGEVEPLDPLAGHIPGALNRPFTDNFDDRGHFKTSHVLRQEFEALMRDHPGQKVVHQCGSGVTAIVNILAMRLAGLEPGVLYPGGWSEWCARSDAQVAVG